MSKVVKSACPLNCWDACGLQVTTENNKVVKVDGDPDHPITQGKICNRGRMLKDRANSPDRLLHPLKKVNNEFVQVSWVAALNDIASKMQELKTAKKTTALLYSHDYSNNAYLKNLDRRFFNIYGPITEVVGSLCWGAGIEAQKRDFGNAYSHAPEDIQNSKAIVIWGRNVATTNMHLFLKIKQAHKKGIPIIVIDPMYNATAKISDLYVSVRPGMDGFLALGIMKLILEHGKEDSKFIKNHTLGFEDVKQLIDGISLDEICEITSVSRETIEKLVKYYTAGPATSFIGLGMQRYQNGGNTIRTIDALAAMSGNIGIPGGGVNYANLGVAESFTTKQLTLEDRKRAGRAFTRMNQAEDILRAKEPKVEVAMITRSNPLTQVPNTNALKEALASIETVVVIDQYLTDTAKAADYVLPCTTSFEEEDIYFSSMYHHYVNYGPKIVAAPGEAKSDQWIWKELAARLGFGEVFNYTTEEFLRMGLTELETKGFSLERVKEKHHALLPLETIPWRSKDFQTPSGKYEFTSQKAEQEGKDGKIRQAFPSESRETAPRKYKEHPYRLLSVHPGQSNHSQHYPLIKSLQKVTVQLSEAIAKKNRIKDGDPVLVYNHRGRLKGTAVVKAHIHPEVVNIEEGQWNQFGGSVNALTSGKESDIGVGSTLYDCLVNVRKVKKDTGILQ